MDEKASNYVEAVLPNGSRLAISREKELTKKELDRACIQKTERNNRTFPCVGCPYRSASDKNRYAKNWKKEWMKALLSSGFKKKYLASEEKTILAWEIANREKELLDRLDYKNGYSLYVGIPFCPSVCSYCSFSSGPH